MSRAHLCLAAEGDGDGPSMAVFPTLCRGAPEQAGSVQLHNNDGAPGVGTKRVAAPGREGSPGLERSSSGFIVWPPSGHRLGHCLGHCLLVGKLDSLLRCRVLLCNLAEPVSL